MEVFNPSKDEFIVFDTNSKNDKKNAIIAEELGQVLQLPEQKSPGGSFGESGFLIYFLAAFSLQDQSPACSMSSFPLFGFSGCQKGTAASL